MIVPPALVWTAWLAASPVTPHPGAQDTSALAFLGIRAGAPLVEIAAELRRRGGRLRCDRARTDTRVSECHGTLRDAAAPQALAVWVSAIDNAAGVITVSAPVSATTLRDWRDDLMRRYGRVDATAQGAQRMMQWVRRGRMLRLTWRPEGTDTAASVSLVDGGVLDRWGRERTGDADADPAQRSRTRKLPSESSRK